VKQRKKKTLTQLLGGIPPTLILNGGEGKTKESIKARPRGGTDSTFTRNLFSPLQHKEEDNPWIGKGGGKGKSGRKKPWGRTVKVT